MISIRVETSDCLLASMAACSSVSVVTRQSYAIGRGKLGIVHRDIAAGQSAGGLFTEAELSAEGTHALRTLQIVNALVPAVVEKQNVDLVPLLNAGQQIGVTHQEAAVADEGIDFVLGIGQLDAQSAGDS